MSPRLVDLAAVAVAAFLALWVLSLEWSVRLWRTELDGTGLVVTVDRGRMGVYREHGAPAWNGARTTFDVGHRQRDDLDWQTSERRRWLHWERGGQPVAPRWFAMRFHHPHRFAWPWRTTPAWTWWFVVLPLAAFWMLPLAVVVVPAAVRHRRRRCRRACRACGQDRHRDGPPRCSECGRDEVEALARVPRSLRFLESRERPLVWWAMVGCGFAALAATPLLSPAPWGFVAVGRHPWGREVEWLATLAAVAAIVLVRIDLRRPDRYLPPSPLVRFLPVLLATVWPAVLAASVIARAIDPLP